jgi:uncharacterized protein (TIGR03067 family)
VQPANRMCKPASVLLLLIASGEALPSHDEPLPDIGSKKFSAIPSGRWVIIGGVADGKAGWGEAEVSLGEFMIYLREGSNGQPMRLDWDPTANPPRMDILCTNGKIPGIYRLQGDSLQLCWVQGKGERPSEFSSKPGSKRVLLYLRRSEERAANQR